jgi:hypothetical protein
METEGNIYSVTTESDKEIKDLTVIQDFARAILPSKNNKNLSRLSSIYGKA